MGKKASRAKKSAGKVKQPDNEFIGTIRWFNRFRAYGFIEPEGGGATLFVRRKTCEEHGLSKKDMKPGVLVRGEHGPGRPGKCNAVTAIKLAA